MLEKHQALNVHCPAALRRLLAGSIACAVLLSGAAAEDWPSFRGRDARGVAESGEPPVRWDVGANRNVAWSTPIPGLGHSSPVVFGDRVFVTSAVARAEVSEGFNPRAERATDANEPHAWRLYCLDRRSGRILWERTAHQGAPSVKRHPKASHASATPATDGTRVVAMMGSEGLFAYDFDGRLLWKRDFGRLNVGYAADPTDEWGPASSPVIHDGLVIVQNDRHQDSYLAAFDVTTGNERWRVGRDELPSWSTPAVAPAERPTLVTNSPRFIRGHDLATGKEIWRIPDHTGPGPEGQVKVVTPVVAGNLVIVTGGYPTGSRPIFAIEAATGKVAWQLERGSPYTPTPIVYRDILYVCVDNGVLSAYDVKTGRRLYQQRISPDAGGFSASPVASAGRLYFTSEDGVVYVVRAGETFELLATNDMRQMCFATPAISDGLLLVRTRTHLHALRDDAATGSSGGTKR